MHVVLTIKQSVHMNFMNFNAMQKYYSEYSVSFTLQIGY